MKNAISVLVVSLLIMLLTACVTTTDKPKQKVDKEKVLDSNIRLGMAYLAQDQRDNALRAFTKALEIDSDSPRAHLGMGFIHQVNAEFDAAEKSFKRALKASEGKSKPEIEFSYGRFLMERGRCAEASSFFESAGKDIGYRRRVNAIFNFAVCSDVLGNEEKALSSYQHALNLNNKFAPAALELAHKKFDRGDYAEAKKFLDIYANNARQSPRSLWLGIRIERIFGNKDKEASYALALKNLHPYSREYLEYKNLNEPEK